jgi:hypothetical protein
MSSMKRQLEILEIIGSLGKATRMEVFHSFDGMMPWHDIKARITWLCAEGLIKHNPGTSPDRPHLWSLTKKGEDTITDFFDDITTEIVEQ